MLVVLVVVVVAIVCAWGLLFFGSRFAKRVGRSNPGTVAGRIFRALVLVLVALFLLLLDPLHIFDKVLREEDGRRENDDVAR